MSNIIQWNCRGLRANFDELKLIMEEHQPIAICLQETMLPENYSLNCRRYEITSVTPPHANNKPCGGVAIMVNSNLPHRIISLNTQLQAVAVRITTPKSLTICSVYLPPSSHWDHKDLLELSEQLPVPSVIMGDFNAHNTLWGETHTDKKGDEVELFLSQSNLCLLNSKVPTYLHPATGSYSSIDLTICDPSIFSG